MNSQPSPTPGENLAAADRLTAVAALSSCAGCQPEPVALPKHPFGNAARFTAIEWRTIAETSLHTLNRELHRRNIKAAQMQCKIYVYCRNKEIEAKASPDGKAAP